MKKKISKIKKLKNSFLTKDLHIFNESTRELINHASKHEINPHQIYLCYLNIQKTWLGINLHKCFLSICIENLKILGAEKNGYIGLATKVQKHKILDEKLLNAVIKKISIEKSSAIITSKPNYKKSIKLINEDEATMNEILNKLNIESLKLYNSSSNFSTISINRWLNILKTVEKRISSRINIEKLADEPNQK